MKKIPIFVFLFISALGLFAQKDDDKEKRLSYQFKQRIGFYTVDARYRLNTDTIYHSFDGFHVWSNFDIEKINDKDYMIFSYPKFKADTTKKTSTIILKENISIDSLFAEKLDSLFKVDTIKAKVYKQIIDTLKIISKNEILKRPVHLDLYGKNGLKLALPKEEFDNLKLQGKIVDRYSLELKHALSFATGFMTIPFKLRPAQDTVDFNMTTDITLGAYIGAKFRISRYRNNYLILPVTLGLSYINVGNSQTSNVNTSDNSSVVPGWTWSLGTVFDLNGFNIGFVLGRDYASGVGDKWLYNKKTWYSFSIGYSFFAKGEK